MDQERDHRARPRRALTACLALLLLGGLALAQAQRAGTPALHPSPTSSPAAAPAEPLTPSGYRLALPPYRFHFPRDHAAHPDYQTEWWYYTGHLRNGQRTFGYELTFFQVGIDPELKKSRSAWVLHTLYFAHFTVTDENRNRFRVTESVSRPALGMAGSETARYHAWIHDWSAELLPDDRTHRLRAAGPGFAIALDLTPQKPPVIHGFGGVSQKAAGRGRASHYYSLTRLATQGRLTLNGETLPVTGLSWMDHEFGSNQLGADQAGWDWFSLQLDDGRELMLYLMRLKSGGVDPVSSGTWVHADGTWQHLARSEFQVTSTGTWQSPATHGRYPAGWTVRLPAEGLELTVTPTVADQELAPELIPVRYWEGSVRVEGRQGGRTVRGAGYVELTGYSGAPPGV
jgi:predicted secreted hydrolase